ncbi:acid phosphatase, partial [Panus rudis PR-1116 ss-1]
APPLGLPDRVQRQWGQYSPWFPAEEYPPPPESCELVQVHVLQRHGARYPNSDDEYDKSVGRLLKAKEFKDSKLDFLRAYEYELDEEELSAFGAAQSFESGQQSYRRYSSLVTQRNLPFVRAAGKSRVIDSARNWTVGFAAASHQRYNPTVDVIIPEDQNNTLHNDCPNATDGTKEKQTWLHVFAPPIAKRLSQAAKGAKVSDEDVFNLMAMCPFETIANQRPSEFCSLFTDDEFKMFEYHGDVEKFYKTGYGNELGPVQGVGYINELLARLTVRPVEDHTQHNDSFPFPLGRSIYADFTHENLMVAVYSAMGLFNISDNPLSTKKMDKDRIWIASRMVPFSARMVVEKLACDGPQYTPRPVDEDEDGDKVSEDFWGDGRQAGEYVRVLVNDALQPLEFCGGDENGLCTLEAFVESQGYARRSGDGDFEKCY